MKIDSFNGEYEFLSNFFSSPIEMNGIMFPTVEHYFQAMKTLDTEKRKEIAAAPTPGKAKYMGRHVNLRQDWNEVKIDVMRQGLEKKFSKPRLRRMLLETGDTHLEEGNWWHDTFWGTCEGEGENHLGKLLMEIREEIRKEQK